jgi:hypothetical protein
VAWFEGENGVISATTRARLQALVEAVPESDPRRAERIGWVETLARHADQQDNWNAHRLRYELPELRRLAEGIATGEAPFRASEARCADEATRGWTQEARRALTEWDVDEKAAKKPFHPMRSAAVLARTASAMGCIEGQRAIADTWPETRRVALEFAGRTHPAPANPTHCAGSRENLLQMAAIPDDSPAGPAMISQTLRLAFTLIQLRCLVEEAP